MSRLARLPLAALALASSSTALAAAQEPTASISMSPTGWVVSVASLAAIGAAIWVFKKMT